MRTILNELKECLMANAKHEDAVGKSEIRNPLRYLLITK